MGEYIVPAGDIEFDAPAELVRLIREGKTPQEAIAEVNRRRSCECCNGAVGEEKAGVASIPGVPMSILWCKRCVQAGVIPLWVAVAEVAMCGGSSNVAPEYLELVAHTLEYFNVAPEKFDEMVAESIREFIEHDRQMAEMSESIRERQDGENHNG